MRVLHIAGTKGKGSTAVFTAAVLQQRGFSVGLFTSPHLCDVRERFRLSGCAPCPRVAALCFEPPLCDVRERFRLSGCASSSRVAALCAEDC